MTNKIQTFEKCIELMKLRTRRNDQTGCLIWEKGVQKGGYGIIKVDGVYDKTHRLAWKIANGPIPPGMWVLHTCDNRRCCEPTHLFLGTAQDNILDMTVKGRAGKKLTVEDIIEIRTMISDGYTNKEISANFGCDPSNISRIRTGVYWPHSYEGRVAQFRG